MRRLSILAPVLGAFVLAGCANYQGPIKVNRTVCMVAGAVVGGVVAGASRNHNGGDGKDNRGAAAAGAAGGALAGYLLCGDSEQQAPTARASAEPQSGTAPLTVELRSTASGRVVSYEWDFGDGSSGSGQTVSHTYQDPGEYRPTVTVTDDSGLRASASAGVMVSAAGAPAPTPAPARRIVLRGVTFAFDSAELSPEAQVTLEVAVEALSDSADARIRVAGHTDATGPDAYNQLLSERRALSVADYLKSAGISAGRVGVKGYGESQPVADNGTRDGRAQNRRVELNVLD